MHGHFSRPPAPGKNNGNQRWLSAVGRTDGLQIETNFQIVSILMSQGLNFRSANPSNYQKSAFLFYSRLRSGGTPRLTGREATSGLVQAHVK
jgi:hypothetical protein